ncbi:hypothetical protein HDF19_14445 [Mucilaginibacter sp. E4BP6]|uniref:hypothetical protein n=1 Tax=Mucilaginibacter sp. E4BP6 TaxID=2723089 RepID=UPI0015C81EBC|nr:hypothetical protein [Mucilaginibacter sp. E4BP6]NYE65813.1 hypothetical protein [Mucilaginibacter sp. E4BP6]
MGILYNKLIDRNAESNIVRWKHFLSLAAMNSNVPVTIAVANAKVIEFSAKKVAI